MGLEAAVAVLNRMVSDRVVSRYAIGGAFGAMFYIEPIETEDLDVYVDFPPDQVIASLEPIYAYLESIGYSERRGIWVIIEGIPVQFLPVAGPLLEEAARQAVNRPVGAGGTPASVFREEHLIALAVSLARPDKDLPRIRQFLAGRTVDSKRLAGVLKRHKLAEKYKSVLKVLRGR